MSAELPADSPDGAADDTPKVSVTLFYLVSVLFCFSFLFRRLIWSIFVHFLG